MAGHTQLTSEQTMISGPRSTWHTSRVFTSLCLAAMLVACGGGTSQFEPFVPDRYVAFGDETSVVRPDGKRYTVNPLTSAGAIDCKTEPIWTQAMANQYGFVFEECNPDNTIDFKAQMRAVVGARIDDLPTQIDAQIARGGFTADTLVTVMLGANDVIEQYGNFGPQTEEQISTELRARGVRLAQQINRLVDLGARVIVSTVLDMGLTPYALAQKAAFTDTDRAALLTRLTVALNSRLRVTILNDGRYIGLVLADEAVQSIVKVPSAFGVINTTSAVCLTALPDCTTATLAPPADTNITVSSLNSLWADDLHMAYGGQSRLGSLAVARAVGNPF